MSRSIKYYAGLLLSSRAGISDLEKTHELLESAELVKILDSPTVPEKEKKDVIEDLFPLPVREFVFNLATEEDIEKFDDVAELYKTELDKISHVARAQVICVTPPSLEQLKKIKQFVCTKTGADEADVSVIKDESLIGGFIIKIGNTVYDRSLKSKISEIKTTVTEHAKHVTESADIISVLKAEIKDYEFETASEEVGSVISVGDSIAKIHGLDNAMYGEIVIFENGVKGMVQDIKEHFVGCILFGEDRGIHEGTHVKRTHKRAGVPVGEEFIGRVVNALGEPIDGKGEIHAKGYRFIEESAPAIIDRKPVSEPLETGILTIDSMFPIGRGQRELIIGDRQTGKTAIAVDAIINQKGKNCVCIYNAIGQKASTVSNLVAKLKKHGAMDYTVVVCSTASDLASLQYISPYAATSIAEYFMHKGMDCLIVYDDLSKHAVAYRALSLLLERSPGREAYPGDVFYLHSRLLERSSCLSDELGGGSLTALPIIETQAGDVSAYIPTNVISITDGQIFLESDLFFSGQRPAVNVGLSVSRVGGAAQTKAMKKAAGSLRVDLAQFREMEVFTQFSSDLDDDTKANLSYGRTLMELLKQPMARPMSLAGQIITLVGATTRCFSDIPLHRLKEFQGDLLAYFDNVHFEITSEIQSKKVLTDELRENIVNTINEFKKANNGKYA
ncbi:MAG: F0F1 ATP synthase subunit alpha [Clostridiales bacterium]|nr:F0F1 ATP synthase subunit alpha [Clostridiales bacterium]